jgi:hypothetical protein
MFEDKDANQRINAQSARKFIAYEPPGWLSTEELEQELLMAVVADSNLPRDKALFEHIDGYFAADEPETESQYRHSLLRLLADLRPQLAELVGGPGRCE